MPGYKVFLQGGGKIAEGLICPHCDLVLRDPVQTTESGLRFCRECFTRKPSGLDPNDEVRNDVAVKKEIDKLSVVCPNGVSGCEWRGVFKDCTGHLISCEITNIPRDNGVQPTSFADSETYSSELGSKVNEQLRIGDEVQQVSGPTEDVAPGVSHGDQAQLYPPLGKQGFQEYTMTKLDEIDKWTDNVEKRTGNVEKRTGNMEKRTGNVEKRTGNVEKRTDNVEKWTESMERKTDDLVKKLMDFRKQQLYTSCGGFYNGYIIWRIPGVAKQMRYGGTVSLYSQPFYTKPGGYKMCLIAYLNGDGAGKGSHLSVYFAIMMGEYDPLLEWPFVAKVSLMLLKQDCSQDTAYKDIIRSFIPDSSSCFQKPTSFMNPSIGYQRFVPLLNLSDSVASYVKDDVMFIKAVVDAK